MSLAKQRSDWEELGAEDPLWAILSEPSKRGGRWDLAQFLAAGEVEIRDLMAWCDDLGRPEQRHHALDFGCGVGRNSRALASRFEHVVGVDVSEPMIRRARELNADAANSEFVINESPDLKRFDDGTFDLVYCYIVLQHMASTELIEGYIREFVRVLSTDGLLVFQLPSTIPWRYRLQPRRHLYRMFRAVGVRPAFLMNRLGLHPISMRAIDSDAIRGLLTSSGATSLAERKSVIEPFGIESVTYAVART
jgi:SAM-dependent methyltransferase